MYYINILHEYKTHQCLYFSNFFVQMRLVHEEIHWYVFLLYYSFCVFFFYIKREVWVTKSHFDKSAVSFRNDFSHSSFGNWIEISCDGLGKRQPRIDVETDSWLRRHCHLSCSRLFLTNVMVLWCQRQMDIAHSLRILFSITRRTYHENISSWHLLALVER